MNEDKSKLQLIGKIAEANNKNLELIEKLNNREDEIEQLRLELSGYRQAILQDKEMLGLKQEIERLHSIIKEVKKYIEDTKKDNYKLVWLHKDKTYFEAGIEEILDKGE